MCASSLYCKIRKYQQVILGKTKENGEKHNKSDKIVLAYFQNKFALCVRCGETLVIMGEKS
jgi:hypothetical protein